MDNISAKKCRKYPKIVPKSSHPAAIFSVLPEKMLDSGRYRKVLKRIVTPSVAYPTTSPVIIIIVGTSTIIKNLKLITTLLLGL